MALLQKGVAAATHRMPKMISPGGHAVADYANAGIFALMGVLFWRKNPPAALAAFAAGVAEVATALATDYPGGVVRAIDFSTHGAIDMTLAATLFAVPGMLRFDDSPEAKYFRIMSLNLTAVAGLTDFEGEPAPRRRRRAA
jgi:hypothetical protein